ncbi:hypothetical protein Trydic_g3927 [Trypoxylus dichotomus]
MKEIADLIEAKKERVESKVSILSPTLIQQGNISVTMRHVLYITMLDGEVASPIQLQQAAASLVELVQLRWSTYPSSKVNFVMKKQFSWACLHSMRE